ncbi:ovomucoid-like [Sminthopsis crassicaudata]|uniref:ovomucoid-like n=1 Tax=Sminthopsis crassicaudata TaxID=9301 RepID=UPI003D681B13
MKTGALCLLTLVTMLNAKLFLGETIDCSEYEKPPLDEFPACTREFMPICGSDGKTYANKCIFCHSVKKSHDKLQFSHEGFC